MPIIVRTMPVAVAGAAALLGLLAVLDPMLAVAGSVAVAFGGLMLADLGLGLCLFAFSASLFEAIPEFESFSVAKVIGLALALTWFAALAARPNMRGELFSEQPGYTVLLVLLATWGLASVLWAEESSVTLADCLRLTLNLLLVPIAFAAVKDTRTLRLLIAALLAGIVASVAYGLLVAPVSLQEDGRLAGAGLDPNYLALWLIIAATLGLGVAARRHLDPALRWLVVGTVVVCAVAAMATGSRTGLIAMGAVLLAAPLAAGRRRRATAAILAILAIAGSGLFFSTLASDAVRERITDTQGGGSGRTDIWTVGFRMAAANPVLGVGLGNFQTSSIHYLLEPGTIKRSDYIIDHPKVAHNTYLELLAEIGGVGLALYLGIVAYGLWAVLRAARLFAAAGLRDEDVLARAVLLAMIAGVAGSAFVSIQYTKPIWLLLALGPVVLQLARAATPAPAGR